MDKAADETESDPSVETKTINQVGEARLQIGGSNPILEATKWMRICFQIIGISKWPFRQQFVVDKQGVHDRNQNRSIEQIQKHDAIKKRVYLHAWRLLLAVATSELKELFTIRNFDKFLPRTMIYQRSSLFLRYICNNHRRYISDYNIFAAVCIERQPIIAPELNIIEKAVKQYLAKVEDIHSIYSDHEMKHFEDV